MSGTGIEEYAQAVHSALLRDLPEIEYKWRKAGTKAGTEVETRKRRPRDSDIEVIQFQQTWENTAVGLDIDQGWAGQAFTDAYTTVVISQHAVAAIYFGGHLAYMKTLGPALSEDISRRMMVHQSKAYKYGPSPEKK
jgi:hypothetical protein